MRSKVVTNLDTSDPLEAEILDMLSGMKSSHRRQERLRSLLKAGYNLLHKNLGKEQAIAQAFDRLDHSDFSMILSLLAQNNQFLSQSPVPVDVAAPLTTPPSGVDQPPGPLVVAPEAPLSERADASSPGVVKEAMRIADEPPAKIIVPPRAKYEELDTSLDDFGGSSFLDVDPSLLAMEREKADGDEFVDPLKRLFGRGNK